MRALRVLYGCFFVTIVLFVVVGELVDFPANPEMRILAPLLGFVGLAVLGIGVILRRNALDKARDALRRNPNDSAALEGWRSGHFLSFVFAESIGLFGLVVRLVTGTIELALPFYLVGATALILWVPRRPDA